LFLNSALLFLNPALLFLNSALCCFSQAVCLSVSTVPLNAEISNRSHEGRHGEPVDSTSSPQVAPDAGVGDESEEGEILFIVETQKGNADQQQCQDRSWNQR